LSLASIKEGVARIRSTTTTLAKPVVKINKAFTTFQEFLQLIDTV
jgi:hypothetical protein